METRSYARRVEYQGFTYVRPVERLTPARKADTGDIKSADVPAGFRVRSGEDLQRTASKA